MRIIVGSVLVRVICLHGRNEARAEVLLAISREYGKSLTGMVTHGRGIGPFEIWVGSKVQVGSIFLTFGIEWMDS